MLRAGLISINNMLHIGYRVTRITVLHLTLLEMQLKYWTFTVVEKHQYCITARCVALVLLQCDYGTLGVKVLLTTLVVALTYSSVTLASKNRHLEFSHQWCLHMSFFLPSPFVMLIVIFIKQCDSLKCNFSEQPSPFQPLPGRQTGSQHKVLVWGQFAQ